LTTVVIIAVKDLSVLFCNAWDMVETFDDAKEVLGKAAPSVASANLMGI